MSKDGMTVCQHACSIPFSLWFSMSKHFASSSKTLLIDSLIADDSSSTQNFGFAPNYSHNYCEAFEMPTKYYK